VTRRCFAVDTSLLGLLFLVSLLVGVVVDFRPLAHAAPAAQETITFGYAAISPTMAGVWMAKEIGAFERNGLKAELIYISSGSVVIQALIGGSVQVALGAGRRYPQGSPYRCGCEQHAQAGNGSMGAAGD